MYKIMCDDYVLHDSANNELKVIGAKCSLKLNKTGLLTFQIHPTHPYYDKIKKHTSIIKLCQDENDLFYGRVLNDEITFDNIKNIECEGELSYLLDTIHKAGFWRISDPNRVMNVIETYLTSILGNHNYFMQPYSVTDKDLAEVFNDKGFNTGVVTVTDPNNYFYRISSHEDSLTAITDGLLNSYGGYLRIRHEDGYRFLDYLSELTDVCNQTIEFGKNIVDMTRYIKGEDVYTALIPLGAKTGESVDPEQEGEAIVEKRLTIESLGDEVDGTIYKVRDFIYDKEAVKQWGWIWKAVSWDDVTVPENLLTKAKAELRNSINANIVIELTAIDLHILNVDIDRISLGDRIRCISKPHNLDEEFIVESMDIDIDAPENTKINLVLPTGKTSADKTISSSNKDNKNNVDKVKNGLSEDYPSYNDVDKKFSDFETDLKNWTKDNFMPKATDRSGNVIDMSLYAKIADVNSAFNELATAINGV